MSPSPLARAKGRGAARRGLRDWTLQRACAVSNLALAPLLLFGLGIVAPRGDDDFARWIAHPLVAPLVALTLLSVAAHAKIGMQVVIEDYAPEGGVRMIALLLNAATVYASSALAMLALLRLALASA